MYPIRELDFWGRLRRAIAAADDQLEGLIEVYRALGGGWQIRRGADQEPFAPSPPARVEKDLPAEEIPKPAEHRR